MPSTNAIRAFADKVRAAQISKTGQIALTVQEARNLNHEIEILLALLIEQKENSTQPSNMTVEVRPDRW